MSLKRSSSAGRGPSSGADSGAKINREDFYELLKKYAGTGQVFTPVDVALSIGAGEPAVSRALLGLAADGLIEKIELGKYRAGAVVDLSIAEFLKAFARASKIDGTRQKDVSEIDRLKKNNDVMRARLLQAQAERDHYLAVLKQHGIDPGTPPSPAHIPGSAATTDAPPSGADSGPGAA